MTPLPSIPLYSLVEIHWIDCLHSQDGWQDVKGFDYEGHTRNSRDFNSAGYLIKIDDSNVFLSGTLNGDHDGMYNCFSIPLGCVLDVKVMLQC